MINFKDAAKTYAQAETVFMTALLAQVEALATSVILSHPHATSFCMAMGSASFGCHWQERDELDPSDVWDRDENLDPDELGKETGEPNSYADELAELLAKYDRQFCITGYPMMIRQVSAHSVTVEADW